MLLSQEAAELFQVFRDFSADLQEGYFAHLRVVFRRKNPFFSIQQTLLCFTHFDTRQVSQQIAFLGYFMVFFGSNEVLSFQIQQAEIVPVGLPKVAEVSTQSLFQFITLQLGVADSQTGIAFFSFAVTVENIESDCNATVESPVVAYAGSIDIIFVECISISYTAGYRLD